MDIQRSFLAKTVAPCPSSLLESQPELGETGHCMPYLRYWASTQRRGGLRVLRAAAAVKLPSTLICHGLAMPFAFVAQPPIGCWCPGKQYSRTLRCLCCPCACRLLREERRHHARSEADLRRNKFDIPGGRTDGQEPATKTAERETWEESGYSVEVGELLATVRGGFHIFRPAVPLKLLPCSNTLRHEA